MARVARVAAGGARVTLRRVTGFATLPFEEQLERIADAVARGDAGALLREAGALPDPEPLAHLLVALAEAGAVDDAVRAELATLLEALPDPALQHLFAHPPAGSPARAVLRDLAVDALERWPVARPSALAFLVRWLRRRAPEAHARLCARAEARIDEGRDDGRALLLVSGARLSARRDDPAWRPLVERTVAAAIDALARAPKSISQANAERLLARRVYADPGHFLFELLQNADDAGATAWTARVERDRAVVTHDGAPFSFLDLVGVLSIGQTTKAAQQIGFFGVGFKSVYEVCERPRIHSGAFDVEIAHVSIPRRLGGRPEGLRDATTALVLPFTPDVDADALFRRARRIPPETLLTLPHVRRLTLRGPDGAARRWREARDGAIRVLRGEGGGAPDVRRFRTAERTRRFEGPREEGRSTEGRVLVAVAVDADGAPIPLRGPTLFSFLPTAERTGLRVLVHARFDVTLDRERLELGSPWNEALLATAGEALAEAALALVAAGHDPLAVLAGPEELAPSVAPLAEALRAGLEGRPCLPAADGSWIAPRRARLLPAPLAEALAALDLGEGHRALRPLEARARAVARFLGARPVTDEELVALLGARLAEGAPPPPWLDARVLRALADVAVPDAALRELPLVRDGAGNLVRAARARVAAAPWAALYAGLRPVVSTAAVAALPDALRARLTAPALDPAELLADLEGPLREALLAREAALLAALAEADDGVLGALRDVSLLRDAAGTRRAPRELFAPAPSLAPLAPDLAAASRAGDAAPLAFVAPELAARHPALVRRWVPTFDLEELADALDAGLRLGPDAARRLAAVLDERAATVGRALARRLGAHPLFADRHGVLRPLFGPDRARVAADGALEAALPSWPWLDAPERPFVRALEPPRADAATVARALAGDGPPVEPDALARLFAWLERRAGELPARLVDALAEAPVWPDRGGVPRALAGLRRGGGEGAPEPSAVGRYYDAAGGRRLAHPATLRLADALRLSGRLPASDHGAVVLDLVSAGVPPDVDRDLLAEVLAEAAERLAPHELRPLFGVPLFEDEAGAARPLAAWDRPEPGACHRPGPFRAALAAGSLPLLSEADERRFAALLAAAGPPPASVHDVAARAADLLDDPDRVLDALEAEAAALRDEDRAAVAALPLFASRAGGRAPADRLCDRAPFVAALGEARVEALGLDEAWLAPGQAARLARLGLAPRPGAALLEEAILPGLRSGAPLEAQPAPWRTREALWALLALFDALGLDPREAPLCLDAGGRTRVGPLWSASEAARRLAAALPLGERLADAAWAAGPADPGGARPAERGLVAPLPARPLAEALREACPEEAPREGHPVVRDPGALARWLREAGPALAEDEAARAALGAAAVLPSQRGTLRAPRDLVLDPSLPDLGLDWGLAPDVPADVARWLADTYELDRRARRAIVAHVLDGLDAAAAADDPARASELVRFLARALGAPQVDADGLERRARRAKVRARLKVPVHGGGWEKPRFAWAPSDAVAERAEAFAAELPPRIALPDLDGPARALLAACGARADLDEHTVDALLAGEGLRPGPAARRALARYVAVRALERPVRLERWRLAHRAWVPDRTGALRRPAELLWPDDLAEALFGDAPSRFPDAELAFDLSDEAGTRLGFARAAGLSLADVAAHAADREARPALLDWLEEGLRAGRLDPSAVRRALRDRLRLRDDAGVARRPSELARRGARALFGRWRGDFGAAADVPRLARALGIPDAPDAPMIQRFVAEAGEARPALSEDARDELGRRLPECYERLGELAASGVGASIPEQAAVAALRGGRVVVTSLAEPSLRLLEPPELAEALPEALADAIPDPLPTFGRGEALARLLWAAGVPDLWTVFRVGRAVPGPARADLEAAAERLRASLAAVLGDDAVGRRARVVDGLAAEGRLELRGGGAYRASPRVEATVAVDALVHDGELLLTPDALREPARLAPALAAEPRRRAATARWLEAGDWERAPKRVRREPERARPARPEGLWSRLKRAFGRDAPAAWPRRPAPPARGATRAGPGGGEGFFRPDAELGPQLEGGEGWLEGRRVAPEIGFAFAPPRLDAPWLYAPKLVATRFERRGQRWRPAAVRRPEVRGAAGTVSMRGTLPKGDALLPVPLYGRLDEVWLDGGDARTVAGPSGGTVLRLERGGEVRLRITLGPVPDLDAARAADRDEGALERFVPDGELPEEVLDFLADLDDGAPPIRRALAVRDFVRARYRYDPSYLEDPAVGRWLAKVTRGRAHAHVAALHAAGDATHLGAGVCYELNALACELLRRAGVPAAVATGWVLDGGTLSEPDHLWALALLEDARGAPVWVPIDASTTRSGRPLRVPRRPPGRFRAPRAPRSKAPKAPTRWDLGGAGGRPPARGGGTGSRGASPAARKPGRRRPPRAELRRLVRYLERVTGRRVAPDEREALEEALRDRRAAARLLERLLGGG